MLLTWACAGAIASLAACSGGSGSKCTLPAAPWTAGIVFANSDASSWQIVELVEGGQIPLIAAPQGGHIVLVGARVDGGDGCEVDTTAALRDPSTGRVVALDDRATNLADDGTGWGVPIGPSALAALPNVGVCPIAVSTTSADGATFHVEITLADRTHTPRAMIAANAVLVCGDDACRADCAPH